MIKHKIFKGSATYSHHNIKTTNKPLKSVAEFKYLGMTGTDQNYIYKELRIG
jgi:hypothetical protein